MTLKEGYMICYQYEVMVKEDSIPVMVFQKPFQPIFNSYSHLFHSVTTVAGWRVKKINP